MRKLKTTTTDKNYKHLLKHSFQLGAMRQLRANKGEYQRFYQLTVIKYLMSQMTREPYELDHIIPFKHNGKNEAANIVVTTKDFNRRKGTKRFPDHIERWWRNEEKNDGIYG